MLGFYDSDRNALSTFRSVFDGQLGGDSVQKIYVRNTSVLKYYTNVVLSFLPGNYNDNGVWDDTGWSVKFLYGERRPTEAEWDSVLSAEPIQLPDIGNTNAADDSTYHPIWIRVYAPGNQDAHRRTGHSMQLTAEDHVVGA